MNRNGQSKLVIEQFKDKDRMACVQLICKTMGLEDACDAHAELFTFQEDVVVRLRGKVIGVCGIYRTGMEPDGWCGIGHFAVQPSLQGHGIGRQLYMWAEQSAKQRGYTTLFVWSKGEATAFYKHFGFRYNHSRRCGPAYSRQFMTKHLLRTPACLKEKK